MTPSMGLRIYTYAVARRSDPKWKHRLHALLYGASISMLSRIR
jgi:hypothetical protein